MMGKGLYYFTSYNLTYIYHFLEGLFQLILDISVALLHVWHSVA